MKIPEGPEFKPTRQGSPSKMDHIKQRAMLENAEMAQDVANDIGEQNKSFIRRLSSEEMGLKNAKKKPSEGKTHRAATHLLQKGPFATRIQDRLGHTGTSSTGTPHEGG